MKMKGKKLHIAVTGLNNTDNPGPGVPVIRGIRESVDLEVKIIGLAYENLEPGIYMPNNRQDLFDSLSFLRNKGFLNRILEIHEREDLDLIIPNFDAELYTFIKSADLLSGMVSGRTCLLWNSSMKGVKPICLISGRNTE